MKFLATLMTLVVTSATAGVDNQAFYATRKQQIFKQEDARELEHGYAKGDNVPYFTWEGALSNKPFYFEIHGENMRLIQSRKKIDIPFIKAPSLPGADPQSRALDDKGPSLFIKSEQNAKYSLICVESLGPDIHLRPRPYKEVYLITNPLENPRLYRLSGINSSCRGIERAPNGKLIAPVWDIERRRTPNVIISYFSLDSQKLKRSNIRFAGSIIDEYSQEYEIIEDR